MKISFGRKTSYQRFRREIIRAGQNARQILADGLVVFILLFAVTAFFFQFQSAQRADPDYYYHVGLSRWMQEHSLPRILPQVMGTGWDRHFIDKEFLFHQITALAYRWGDESGVSLVPLFLIWVFIISTAWRLRKTLSAGQTFLVFLICLGSFYWLNRMTLVRPHVLSVLLATQLCFALRAKSKYGAGALAVLYALSYHALQIPILILLIYYLCGSKKNISTRPVLYWALGGLGFGTLIHPYFPGVLGLAWQHLKVALSMAEASHPIYGDEMFPWTTSDLLLANFLTFGVMGIAIYRNEIRNFYFFIALMFWGITFFTPRGQEYAVPMTALLLADLFRLKKGLNQFTFFILGVLCFAQSVQFFRHYQYKRIHTPSTLNWPNQIIDALAEIPEGSSASILNCSWDLGPFVLYRRPNMKFLDLLDPSFLSDAHPDFATLRDKLNQGLIADPSTTIQEIFASQFVLGSTFTAGPLSVQLENDPHFRRLFPKVWDDLGAHSGQIFLYSPR